MEQNSPERPDRGLRAKSGGSAWTQRGRPPEARKVTVGAEEGDRPAEQGGKGGVRKTALEMLPQRTWAPGRGWDGKPGHTWAEDSQTERLKNPVFTL